MVWVITYFAAALQKLQFLTLATFKTQIINACGG
jgi:hypothetical protein